MTVDPITDPRAAEALDRLTLPALEVADLLQRLGPGLPARRGRRPAADDPAHPEPEWGPEWEDDPEADARADAYLLAATAAPQFPVGRARHARPGASDGERRRLLIPLVWLGGAAAMFALFLAVASLADRGGDTDPTGDGQVGVGSGPVASGGDTTSVPTTTAVFTIVGVPGDITTSTTAAQARRRPAVVAEEEAEPAGEPVAEEPAVVEEPPPAVVEEPPPVVEEPPPADEEPPADDPPPEEDPTPGSGGGGETQTG